MNNKRIKRTRYNIKTFVLCVITIIVLFILFGRVGYWQIHYHKEAKIISIENGIVIAKDNLNHLWEFEQKDYLINDTVTLLICTNGTDSTLTDDTIIEVKLH